MIDVVGSSLHLRMAAHLVAEHLAGDLGARRLERSDPGRLRRLDGGLERVGRRVGHFHQLTVLFAIVLYRLWPVTDEVRTIQAKGAGVG
jgi:hypothetical protein